MLEYVYFSVTVTGCPAGTRRSGVAFGNTCVADVIEAISPKESASVPSFNLDCGINRLLPTNVIPLVVLIVPPAAFTVKAVPSCLAVNTPLASRVTNTVCETPAVSRYVTVPLVLLPAKTIS